MNYNHYQGIVNFTDLDAKLTTFIFNGSQVFHFAYTCSAEVSGFYRCAAQKNRMYLIRPMGVFSFGSAKQLMSNKANLKLAIYDPFYIQKAVVDVKLGNVDALVVNRWDNHRAALSFIYRFSKGKNAAPPSRRTGSSQEDQDRVGGGKQ